MKKNFRILLLSSSSIFLMIALGVVFLRGDISSPKPDLYKLEAPVRRLTSALRTILLTEVFESTPTGQQILDKYYTISPDVQELFRGISLSVKHDGHNVVVLVSSPKGDCWFEDSSQTPEVDRPCFRDDPLIPAEFTLISQTESEPQTTNDEIPQP